LFNRAVAQKKILDGVSFDIKPGETLALVGESGCGKTVLVRTILGIEEKTSGTILYCGKDVDDMSGAEKRRMLRNTQLIFQDTAGALHPRMSIRESVEEPLILSGVKDAKKRENVIEDVFRQIGLDTSYLSRFPHQISGGQCQRVVIARCLVLNPQLIFADEPILALDVSLQAQIINILMDLQEYKGISIFLVAHDLAVVRQIANEIMIMYLGTIVESASSTELYANAKHPYTKVLLKAAPSITKGVKNKRFDLDLKPGDTPDASRLPAGCPFSTRCVYADGLCEKQKPKPVLVSEGHTVMCHKWDQLD
jgi:oligopeptide/dipeptide ABC transporter ATP-binding protein